MKKFSNIIQHRLWLPISTKSYQNIILRLNAYGMSSEIRDIFAVFASKEIAVT